MVRAATSELTWDELGYPDAAGLPRLRRQLASYLARGRGARVEPEQLVVCAGTLDGVLRLCRTLRAAGHTRVAIEDPGWTQLRLTVAAAGLTPVPVPVDGQGLRVDLLRREAAVRAVIVAPAHQFPTGVVLAPARRAELADWAREVDGLIMEDDYDAEFRYDRHPVGALQGMAPDHVALLGSLSKTLSPPSGWAGSPLPAAGPRPSSPGTPEAPRPPSSTRTPSPASSRPAPTTGICARPGCATSAAATASCANWPRICRARPSAGRPPDSTCCSPCGTARRTPW